MHSIFKFKQMVLLLCACCFISISNISSQAAGEVDPGFDGSVQLSYGGAVRKIVRQSDGKILAAGIFNAANGHGTNSIARFNSDGTIDKTFAASISLAGKTVYAIAVQSNGKILVSAGIQVIRLNADGTQDTGFSVINSQNQTPFTVYTIKVLPNDSFYIGGSISGFTNGSNIKRYNADGTPDSSFASTFVGISFKIDTQPDGKIIAAGSYASSTTGFVVRLLTDGTIDSSFANVGLNGFVYDFAMQTDGKIVFGGAFTNVNGNLRTAVARITSEGVFDPTFTPTTLTGSVFALRIRSDGKIIIGGNFRSNALNKYVLGLLNTDGTFDNTFVGNPANDTFVQAIELTVAGKVLAGFYYSSDGNAGGILGLTAEGSADTSAVYYISRLSFARRIIEQPDGKIIVAGFFSVANNVLRPGLARFNTDGTLDTTFNPVVPGNPTNVFAVALQADGKILVATSVANQALIRLNADGSRDFSFAPNLTNSSIAEIVVLPSGKILVSGSINDGNGNAGVARFNADGTRDNATFISTTEMSPTKIVVLPSGKFLGTFGSRLLRYNENGSIDNTFNAILEFSGSINDIDVQSDGKIVVVGAFVSLAGNSSHRFIGRLSPDGFTDPTFSPSVDGVTYSVKVQPNGKILIGGQFAFVGSTFHSGMARLNSDGSVDSGFTANTYDIVRRIILLNSGKIFIGGQFNTVNGVSRVSLARLFDAAVPAARAPFDFDGDGRTDVVAYRPSNSVWYQLLGVNYQYSSVAFGAPDDVVAPADFDGDGKTDLAIFRPSTGAWWYASSAQNGAYRAVSFGQSGDIPLPSDTDGDGKADYVVFRPSNSGWYRLTATGQTTSLSFGVTGDKPVIGDFDGDGKADYAVYRPSTGVWWFTYSSQNNATRAIQFGSAEDIPAAGDYDGDGKTDVAVFRPSTGGWYILNSGTNSVRIIQFGLSGDKPVVGDYDGDGKADIAVYRPSNGSWYIQRSTAGFAGLQFGTSTDIPIPNAFTR